jgi:hypothetical protein
MDICARYYSPRNRLRTGRTDHGRLVGHPSRGRASSQRRLDSDLVGYTAANMLRSELRVIRPEQSARTLQSTTWRQTVKVDGIQERLYRGSRGPTSYMRTDRASVRLSRLAAASKTIRSSRPSYERAIEKQRMSVNLGGAPETVPEMRLRMFGIRNLYLRVQVTISERR